MNWQTCRLAVRIGLGMASVTYLVVSLAQTWGFLPDPYLAPRLRRTAISESLAIHASLAAQQQDLAGMRLIAETVARRNPDIAYLAIEQADGRMLCATGDSALANAPHIGMMKATVPILEGQQPWGHVHVVFRGASDDPLGGWFSVPTLGMAAFVATLGLAIYFAYGLVLARGFWQAPPQPMPDRVRETLDTFAEGILVLDSQQRIAFANKSFCTLAGRQKQSLAGSSAEALPWQRREESTIDLPWLAAARQLTRQRTTLELRGDNPQPHALAVNAIPLQDDGGELYGTLATFDDLTTVDQMNSRLRRLLDLLRQSKNKIREQNKELQRLATLDGLTGCLNRRALFERLEGELVAARRYRTPLSCLMVDVDHFKSINDRFGHATGDDVLCRVSACLREISRDADLVGRYGGEEFCLVLPHTDVDGARQTAERCRAAVAALPLGEVSVTISLGVSSLSLGATSVKSLLEQADHALYTAKHTGRNRVVSFHEIADVESTRRCAAPVLALGANPSGR